MIIQWCIKGMALTGGDDQARSLIDSRNGIQCNWWRDVRKITLPQVRDKLSDESLNLHVNHFTIVDPDTKRQFRELTPFISLTAGTVERDAAAKTNTVRRARATALSGSAPTLGSLTTLTCISAGLWLPLGPPSQ